MKLSESGSIRLACDVNECVHLYDFFVYFDNCTEGNQTVLTQYGESVHDAQDLLSESRRSCNDCTCVVCCLYERACGVSCVTSGWSRTDKLDTPDACLSIFLLKSLVYSD